MSTSNKNNQGFTLVEALMTVAIFSVMMGTVYITMIMSQRSLDAYLQTAAPRQNLRMAMAAMVRELREAQNLFIDTRHRYGPNDHTIILTFQRPQYGDLTYAWTDTGNDAGKIIRTNYSNKIVLARNITSLSLTAPFAGEIIIEIGAGTIKGTALRLKEKVALRLQTGMFAESQNEAIK